MTIRIIACEVMKEELLAEPTDHKVTWEWVSMGLHTHPERLRAEVQRLVDATEGVDLVVLAFGLCGGALNGLSSPRFPLVVPRVHDCIPVLLGSRQRYEQMHAAEKGTFYHSVGWMNGMKNSFGDRSILGDWDRTCRRFGPEKARSVLKRMYGAYTRVLSIQTSAVETDEVATRSKDIAALLDLRHERVVGDPAYCRKIVAGPWDGGDFVRVGAGTAVEEGAF